MIERLDSLTILIVASLFFTGYILSPVVYNKRIKFLTLYPIWLTEKLISFIKRKSLRFVLIFPFIFSFNSLSLFLFIASSYVPFLPLVFILWTGVNLGVSIYYILSNSTIQDKKYPIHTMKAEGKTEIKDQTKQNSDYKSIKKAYFLSLLNPVAILEIIAMFLTSAISVQFNSTLYNIYPVSLKPATFGDCIYLFITISIPILLIAALLESTLIILTARSSDMGINNKG